MRKLTAYLLFFILSTSLCFGQSGFIKGNISDTANKKSLTHAVISLLRKSDSVLVAFTRTGETGDFQLSHLKGGNYVLLVTAHFFADYTDIINLADSSTIDLGKIALTRRSQLLQEVLVKQQLGALRVKKDTLEFVADSFKLPPNATVEDLLKRFPGIQVDKNGKITAQGETVEKVLVEGEEFFGNDPTIATKNIQADAVDKVQIFDKKSDQATFTGIDDGQKSRTINLKLKEDKKKGYFGKIDVGGGTESSWNGSAMINRFRSKRKISAYGIMSNTGKTGLDWNEANSYGTGNGIEYNDDFGGFYFSGSDDEFNNSSYYGEGLPKSWSAGINYSNKFGNDKQNLNGSYRYTKLNSEGSGNSLSQSILPDTAFFNKESRNSFSSRQRHSGSGIYEWQIDSSTSLKVTATGYLGKSLGFNNYIGESLNEFGDTVNKSIRNSNSDGNSSNIHSIWILRKRFSKPGRTISLNVDQLYNDDKSNGFLYAINSFYDKANIQTFASTTDQRKVGQTMLSSLNGKITYTEPLSKKSFIELNYGLRNSKSDAEKLSYDKDNGGKYNTLNDTFSNHYKFDVLTNTVGGAFKFNGRDFTVSAGSDIGWSRFKQTNLFKDSLSTRNYTNFYPKIIFNYKFGPNSRLNISYRGNTKQPTIQQIQPVADNSNPLNINVGNPFLKQEFNHNIQFNFNTYKVFSQRGIYIYGNISKTDNAIVTSNSTDTLGRTINQYINTNGNYNAYAGGGYNLKLKKLDMNVSAGFNFSGSRYNNFVNGEKNKTDNVAGGLNIGFWKEKEKKYNMYYNGNFNYNTSTSSIRQDLKTNYWTQEHNFSITVQLPHKFEVNSEIQANLRQKTVVFDQNNNVVLWNAYIGRKLLKNDKAIIKISGHDILNQAKGYNRYINSNVLREDNYQTIKRYFLISFLWNFAKNPMTANP
ncbi:MAG: outer membrane beta-barrel protein [Bacteroidetes bacterium]|nr:outer membrane beta-barrel protein [Bacteroidota bacterium]